jgi:hypothetical protein
MLCEEGKRLKEADAQATRAFALFLQVLRDSSTGVEERGKNERLKKEMKAARCLRETHHELLAMLGTLTSSRSKMDHSAQICATFEC